MTLKSALGEWSYNLWPDMPRFFVLRLIQYFIKFQSSRLSQRKSGQTSFFISCLRIFPAIILLVFFRGILGFERFFSFLDFIFSMLRWEALNLFWRGRCFHFRGCSSVIDFEICKLIFSLYQNCLRLLSFLFFFSFLYYFIFSNHSI